MKKIILIIVGVLVAAGLVAFMVIKQQSGYTKVLTATIVRQDLATVVSGTGQIKPLTYVNLGATAMGRVTHLYVKEGDRVTRGETVATIENIQQQAQVNGQQATILAAKTDIASYTAAEKTGEANLEHAKADLEQKKLDWDRAQALYTAGIMAKQDFDAKKAAYDLDVASVSQAVAQLNQAKAQTDSARGHMQTAVATLEANKDMLSRTIAVAPFNGLVTNEPVREGETVVEGIQNTEGSTLMTLADMSIVTAEVKMDETDIVNIKLDQPAEVMVDALPGKTFKGHVTLVGDQALLRSTGIATSQSTTGTEEAKDFKVVVTIDGDTTELRPGLSCTAKVTTARKSNVLSLPIQALTMHDPASDAAKGSGAVQAASVSTPAAKPNPVQGVFVVDKDPKGRLRAKFVPVTTGITGATDIEVLSGLTQGQEVVSGPYKILRDLKGGSLLKRDKVKVVLPSASNS
ncbi:MAG TPA: efflux RND transporter periplasmic adaptor subunit [Terracidiphilus sp.]|jgi:HlyD family secretion protein|nr:efflux RND transporter periplasmic adaptor subunit [Terracidiphilus sp.]